MNAGADCGGDPHPGHGDADPVDARPRIRSSASARIENLFDRDYEDSFLTEQPGITGYLGIRVER